MLPSTHSMLPFSIQFVPGEPPYEQVIYAVKKAVLAGQLRPGDRFPSVRQLSQDLRINPNTAHKAVAALQNEGILEVLPGVGTVIAKRAPVTPQQRHEILGDQLERLVVEAKRVGLPLDELQEAIRRLWKKLEEKQK